MKDKKEIWITGDNIFADIQVSFAGFFPFLQMNFFHPGGLSESFRSIMIDPTISLKQLLNKGSSLKIDMAGTRTVSELSHDLETTLGVRVGISRKSGNVWNLVSVTDEWTLETQNAAGEFICAEMALPLLKKNQ